MIHEYNLYIDITFICTENQKVHMIFPLLWLSVTQLTVSPRCAWAEIENLIVFAEMLKAVLESESVRGGGESHHGIAGH